MRTLFVFLILLSVTVTAVAQTGKGVMAYRYWDWGLTPQRDDYQVAALQLALEKTRLTHGDYTLERKIETLTRTQAEQEIAKGDRLNIYTAPIRLPSAERNAQERRNDSIAVNVPMMKSLLGYRSLIIRRSDQQKFSEIREAEQLKALIAGQGSGWVDIGILSGNGYAVRADAEYFTLLAMLLQGHFDYIPLSIIEVNGALSRFNQYSDKLMVVPDVMLYYPLPTLLHVSAKQPLLATRLEQGLTLAQLDGSMDALFTQHFSEQLQQLKNPQLRLFVLKNSHVPSTLGLDEPLLTHPPRIDSPQAVHTP